MKGRKRRQILTKKNAKHSGDKRPVEKLKEN